MGLIANGRHQLLTSLRISALRSHSSTEELLVAQMETAIGDIVILIVLARMITLDAHLVSVHLGLIAWHHVQVHQTMIVLLVHLKIATLRIGTAHNAMMIFMCFIICKYREKIYEEKT